MTSTDVFRLLGYVEDDLRGVHAKLTELRAQLAAAGLPSEPTGILCTVALCGIRCRGEGALADHLEYVHGQPGKEEA